MTNTQANKVTNLRRQISASSYFDYYSHMSRCKAMMAFVTPEQKLSNGARYE